MADIRKCEFCGYELTPACANNIEARGCHLYRKVRYGEGDSVEDATLIAEAEARNAETRKIRPTIPEGPHSYRAVADPVELADAQCATLKAAIERKAYNGEPTLGPLSGTRADIIVADEVGGDAVTLPPHYTRWKIEPIFFIEENAMPFWMGNIVKYVTRADAKNGIEDLRKARRYLDMKIKQLEGDPEWAK